jgi:hypothetical protein
MWKHVAIYVTKLSRMYISPRPDQKNEDYEVTKSKLDTGISPSSEWSMSLMRLTDTGDEKVGN